MESETGRGHGENANGAAPPCFEVRVLGFLCYLLLLTGTRRIIVVIYTTKDKYDTTRNE
jgi:hypothetical protein